MRTFAAHERADADPNSQQRTFASSSSFTCFFFLLILLSGLGLLTPSVVRQFSSLLGF
jgi:hypothetical protein